MDRISTTKTTRILVVDDPSETDVLARSLAALGYSVRSVQSGGEGISTLEHESFDAILLDLEARPISGFELLDRIRERYGATPVIVLARQFDVAAALRSMRMGAYDVLEKPVRTPELQARITSALGRPSAPDSKVSPSGALRDPFAALSRLVGNSPSIAKVREQIRGIARFHEVATLVIGETGTGKEVVAEVLHALCTPDRPFVTINCAAIPETLFESELFGHEAGSFTGARGSKPGLLEIAEDGTILLDEIGELGASAQPKLLRVLQNRTFRRVGGKDDIELRARIVSATNRKLNSERQDGMRSDLYFRLAGFTITLPPLRHRPDDIELLANHFLLEFAREYPGVPNRISEQAAAALAHHPFLGNVRELRKVVEQAAVLSDGGVLSREAVELALDERRARPPEAPAPRLAPGSTEAPPRSNLSPKDALVELNELQQKLIVDAYVANDRNLARAARALKIPRTTLRDRLKRYGSL